MKVQISLHYLIPTMNSAFGICIILTSFGTILSSNEIENLKLYTMTVASHETDGLLRLRRSASVYGINLQVFIEPQWEFKEDHIQKVILTRKRIEKFKNDTNVVLLFVDAFDIMFNAGEDEILEKFLDLKANIVFGAEINYICDPDREKLYNDVSDNQGHEYLNSGTIMGYAPFMYRLYSLETGDETDDQCWMTYHFLDPGIRTDFNMKLDYNQHLFQTLYGIEDGLELDFSEDDARLVNNDFDTKPPVIHGNGYSGKKTLKQLENYLAKSWTPTKGCMKCKEGRIDLNNTLKIDYPRVLLGIFVQEETPFLEDMLRKVSQQVYPKEKILVYVYNNVTLHEEQISKWILKHKSEYPSIEYTSSFENVTHGQAKHIALNKCKESACDVFFNVESLVHLDNPNTLGLLISYNRSILAPIMKEDVSLHSTFWGDIDGQQYKRSFDYVSIVTDARRGIWNTQCIYSVYVMWRHVFENPKRVINYVHFPFRKFSPSLTFCINNRYYHTENFMYAVNLEYYGHLVNSELENPEGSYNNIFQIENNPNSWESHYIHPDYYKALNNKTRIKELCLDVFSFPVFKKRFAKDISQLSWNGEIRDRTDEENRVDKTWEKSGDKIYLSEIGFEIAWDQIARKFIEPIVNMIFTGNNVVGNPASSFIRISKPVNQSASPHFDPSVYTIVTALNAPGVDYLGGDIKFFRTQQKECVASPMKSGWVTVYPGKPTHYHEELVVKVGFKYDLIYYSLGK